VRVRKRGTIVFYLTNTSYLTESLCLGSAIDGLVGLGFHQIGRFREDANLRHLYKGPHKTRNGAKKKYNDKVKYDDFSRWEFVT